MQPHRTISCLSALLSLLVCYFHWSQIQPTEESEWILPFTATSYQSMSTVPKVVIHYRTTAKPFVTCREPTNIHLLTSTFACVKTHFSVMSMAVHWLWCIWHLCACVLRFWRGIWGVRSHRRGTQGDFHPNYHPGKLNASDILNRLSHPTICAPVAHLIIIF